MAVDRELVCWEDRFDRSQVFTTTSGAGGWAIADTSSSGTPTYLTVNGGGAAVTLASTSEAEIVTLYQKDILPFPLLNVRRMSFNAKVAGVDAVTTICMGLASARDDTDDSVATNAWFRIEGSASTSAVVCETDDGTTDNDDKATSASLAATYKKFVIDFSNGIADVRFFIDGARVASNVTFSMSAATSSTYVQPLFQVQKASGTGVPAVTIRDLKIEYWTAIGT